MSKVDAQRAMREAKYARDSAGAADRRAAAAAAVGATPAAPPARTPSAKPARAATPATAAAPAGELCGHKSMNGRACTRAAGHPEKNHRYG